MRLVGGNISDTPVKEIGDGSAFAVGGGSGAPALVEIGTVPAAGTSLTNINHSYSGWMGNGQYYSNSAIVKWSDNSFGIFWAAAASPDHETLGARGHAQSCAVSSAACVH